MSLPPAEPYFLSVGHGADCRRIACLLDRPGEHDTAEPGLIWLPGFKSDMVGTKASALAAWAAHKRIALTRLDYSGHGQSGGRFEDGTIGRWLEEIQAVFVGLTRGPQILVGSSMGGYLALLLLRRLATACPAQGARIKGMVLIAPAWDMTERLMWQRFTPAIRQAVMETGTYLRPSRYGDGPYAITRTLIEDGRNHLIGDSPFDPGRPVHVLHGLQDPDVPWEHTLDLVAHCHGDWIGVTAIPDADHRASRPEDLEILLTTVEGMIQA